VIWRSVIVAGYIACALTFSFVFDGGLIVLAFFSVWGLVWLAFSLFSRWAERARRHLAQRPRSGSG
jgi:hypothetical protein